VARHPLLQARAVCVEGEGKAASACGGVKSGGLPFAWLFKEFDNRRCFRGCELAQHGGEFKLGEKFAAGLEVGLLCFHGVEVQSERNMGVDSDQLFREQNGIPILFQRLAIALALDFGGSVEDSFYAAEFDNQIDAALSPMPGAPGMLSTASPRRAITSMTFSGGLQHFDNLGGIKDEVVLLRVENLHVA